jgi:hypothetical protein
MEALWVGGGGDAADGVGLHGGELTQGAFFEPEDAIGDLLEGAIECRGFLRF